MEFDSNKQVTLTKYWNNFYQKKKAVSLNYFSYLIRILKKKIKNIIGYKINIQKIKEIVDSSYYSYQKDPIIINLRNKEIEKILIDVYKKNDLNYSGYDHIKYINEYEKIYRESPVKHLGSGFGFNEGMYLFNLLKIINPTDVIESGVMRGFSTYIIEKATNENARIHCYDISFNRLEYKSKKAIYNNCDISEKDPSLLSNNLFALWDDHVSHYDRLQYSFAKKIKYNLFDDDLGFLNFHSDGWPPIPSLQMILNLNKELLNKSTLEWISQNRLGIINLDELKKIKIDKKTINYTLLSDLFDITGYKNHSRTSFVTLTEI
jgi:hypothetical protein